MTAFNTHIQLVTADGLNFVTSDDSNFLVKASEYGESDYFTDTTNPQLEVNKITFDTYTFAGNDINKFKIHVETGLLTDKLALDTLSVEIKSTTRPEITRYTPVTVYRGSNIRGVFFNGTIEEIGTNLYSLYAESYLALLDYDKHVGGMYTAETVGNVIADIMGDVPYTINPDVAALKLYGYLPYASKRENLQQILIATGAAVRKNTDGTLNFTVLTGSSVGAFTSEKIFIGGSLSEESITTAVQVTEHSYVPITDSITLFTEAFTDIRTAIFSEPAHNLTCTNGTILESSANHAKIQGAGNVTLTGQKYRHTTKILTKGTILNTPEDKILTVSNATLITAINSSSVAQRLYKYASCNKTIKQNVLPTISTSGDMVEVSHPYKIDLLNAAIQTMDFNLSNTMRAAAEFLIGYEPQGISAGYKNRVLITTNSNFIVPEDVNEIRVVLIGGGKGGANGANGENGSSGSNSSSLSRGNGGKGGKAGEPGTGGKVFDTTIEVTPGQSISATMGVGGASGLDGTATTFGTLTSAIGAIGEYVDVMTAERFAIAGSAGFDGADGQGASGSQGGNIVEDGFIIYSGGVPGAKVTMRISSSLVIGAQGGGGSGAAYGNNGTNGADGEVSMNYGYGQADGGNGAPGASAISRTAATIYGAGGDGGHGGGGGGGGGDCYHTDSDYAWVGSGGGGGAGGAGGAGANGCIIIYY